MRFQSRFASIVVKTVQAFAAVGVLGGILLSFQNCGQGFEVASKNQRGLASLSVGAVVLPSPAMGGDSNPRAQISRFLYDDMVITGDQVQALDSIFTEGASREEVLANRYAWRTPQIQLRMDPNTGFSAADATLVYNNVKAACARWSATSKFSCVDFTDESLPYLWVTRSNVPLSLFGGQSVCGTGSFSCATVGRGIIGQGEYVTPFVAIHADHKNNMYTITHEMGHVLGFQHEHQRPGRDAFLTFRSDAPSSLGVITALKPASGADFDFGSIMGYNYAGSRHKDFVGRIGSTWYMAIRDEYVYEQLKESESRFITGNAGYPSPWDAKNAELIYGPPEAPHAGASCSIFGKSIKHGSRVGVYTSQEASSAFGLCAREARICQNGVIGKFVNNAFQADASGFATCNARCTVAGRPFKYGERMNFTYYSASQVPNGQSCESVAKRIDEYCEVGKMGPEKVVAGFASCSVGAAPQPVDCVGSWSSCSATCGGGKKTFTASTQPANGGKTCEQVYGTGAIHLNEVSCNTQACEPAGTPLAWATRPPATITGQVDDSAQVHEIKVSGGKAPYTYTITTPIFGGAVEHLFVSLQGVVTNGDDVVQSPSSDGAMKVRVRFLEQLAATNFGIEAKDSEGTVVKATINLTVNGKPVSGTKAYFDCQTTSNVLENYSMNGKVVAASDDYGKKGFYFIGGYDVVRNSWWSYNGSEWTEHGIADSSFSSWGSATTFDSNGRSGALFSSADLSDYPGGIIYLGYGKGETKKDAWAQMTSTESYVHCGVLPQPTPPPPPPPPAPNCKYWIEGPNPIPWMEEAVERISCSNLPTGAKVKIVGTWRNGVKQIDTEVTLKDNEFSYFFLNEDEALMGTFVRHLEVLDASGKEIFRTTPNLTIRVLGPEGILK